MFGSPGRIACAGGIGELGEARCQAHDPESLTRIRTLHQREQQQYLLCHPPLTLRQAYCLFAEYPLY